MWWTAILETIKSFFGFGTQIAENKGKKIPMQEAGTRAQSATKEVRHGNKQHRLKQVIPKSQIEAEVQTLGLKKKHERKLTNILHDLIEAGATINTIAWNADEDKVIYCYTDKHEVGKSGEY